MQVAMEDRKSSWCAVCKRQIIPKRKLIAVNEPPGKAPGGTMLRRGAVTRVLKNRVEIDQSPLFCSDQCRQREVGPKYPEWESANTTDVLNDDVSDQYCHEAPKESTPNTRSLAILQRAYGWDLEPAALLQNLPRALPTQGKRQTLLEEFTSGVMMANRRIDAVLPRTLKPGERAPPLAPVSGWTDGSQAWRPSTYSFAPPPRSRADILDPNHTAYQSFIAFPHRSARSGVTASSSSPALIAPSSATATSLNSDPLTVAQGSFIRRPPAGACPKPARNSRQLASVAHMLLLPDVMRASSDSAST
ncbi:hypothetical protein B0H14DRAFT_3134537 [Mycena olivaceomarginata]|nr:hypothetical protein B0H14DRAFT_3134537 [Mycena olivaceomarginata]